MAGKVQVNQAGVRALLRSAPIRDDLARRAERVRATAAATAPVGPTGRLAASHRVEVDDTGGRARARVVADTPYAAVVAARNPWLAQALDQDG